MTDTEPCDSCASTGTLPVTTVQLETDGKSGQSYAYLRFIARGRCRGTGRIEVTS